MPFVEIPGLQGKFYVPEEQEKGAKKHPCKDCFHCQQCSDDRCALCLANKACACQKTATK